MDVSGRGQALQASLAGAGCDALLVSHLTNIRYLTGFTGSSGYLWVGPTSLCFITDGRYEEQATEELRAAGVTAPVIIAPGPSATRQALRDQAAGVGHLGIEADHVSWAEHNRYATDVFPSSTLVPSCGMVEALRAVKDSGEVARIEAACTIADAALGAVAPRLEHRLTEAAFALELDAAMRAGGAEAVSFETIVAAGPHGSRPHHTPSNRVIERGDLVVIDFGAMIDGYHSDMTRTIAVGGLDALDATQRRMMAVVGEAQAAGVAAVAAGVSATAVDAACREVIAAAGWAEAFVHGTGHGVGLDIHEAPRVAATSDDTLRGGHVVTVEPGVYLPGHGGVRIEDTVVVTESGCRTLTRAPKS